MENMSSLDHIPFKYLNSFVVEKLKRDSEVCFVLFLKFTGTIIPENRVNAPT